MRQLSHTLQVQIAANFFVLLSLFSDHSPPYRCTLGPQGHAAHHRPPLTCLRLLHSASSHVYQPTMPILSKAFLPPPLLRLHRPRVPCSTRLATTMTTPLGQGKQLFVKAASDGKSLGDCPFSQKANLALRFRHVEFDVHTIDLKDKPSWFLDLTEQGSTPVFVDSTHAIGDSDDIVDYADTIGILDMPVLTREDDGNWDKAFDTVSPIFGCLARYMKNTDAEQEQTLHGALVEALVSMDKFLESVPGAYLLDDNPSSLDCNLMPKLQHLIVAAGHYKKFSIPSSCITLLSYVENFKQTTQWKDTICPDDVIIWGWRKFFP